MSLLFYFNFTDSPFVFTGIQQVLLSIGSPDSVRSTITVDPELRYFDTKGADDDNKGQHKYHNSENSSFAEVASTESSAFEAGSISTSADTFAYGPSTTKLQTRGI